MSRKSKLIAKLDNPSPETSLADVEAILGYFPFEINRKSGSHIIVRHDSLIGKPGFGINGEFSIPVKNGRYVKKWYLKDIKKAISIFEEAENSDEQT